MRNLLIAFMLLMTLPALAQNADEYWAQWDKNYPEVNIHNILLKEKKYADSVEKNPKIAPYYLRTGKYRFDAQYLAEERPVDTAVLGSVKRVFTMTAGNPEKLLEIVKSEVLIKIGEEQIWMPIQAQLLAALKEEAKKGDTVKLYCFFFNEHTSKNKLFNTLLISEFVK